VPCKFSLNLPLFGLGPSSKGHVFNLQLVSNRIALYHWTLDLEPSFKVALRLQTFKGQLTKHLRYMVEWKYVRYYTYQKMVKVVREEVMWCPKGNSKKPSEIYMYAINFYFIAMSAKHFPQQQTRHWQTPHAIYPSGYFSDVSQSRVATCYIHRTANATPKFHQIEGNKGFSLWYASCYWCGALEHDLFLCSYCDPIWVLFLWLWLGSSLFVPPFPHLLGALFREVCQVFIIIEEKEKGQKLI